MSRQLYFDVEEYESAKGAFEEALKLGFDKKEECELWIRKCKAELDSSEGMITGFSSKSLGGKYFQLMLLFARRCSNECPAFESSQ